MSLKAELKIKIIATIMTAIPIIKNPTFLFFILKTTSGFLYNIFPLILSIAFCISFALARGAMTAFTMLAFAWRTATTSAFFSFFLSHNKLTIVNFINLSIFYAITPV